MRALDEPFREMGEFARMQEILQKDGGRISVSGCVDSQKMHMVYGLSKKLRNRVIVTFSDIRTKEIYEDYKLYDRNTVLYPAKDMIFYQADVQGNRLTMERMRVLRRILEGVPVTMVTTFDALMAYQAPIDALRRGMISLRKGQELPYQQIAEVLTATGYEKVYQVEEPGQFAMRGGILDIFDLTEENPYRIELWGDEVDSIRSFDVQSQRSIEQLSSVSIYPATELVLFEEDIQKGAAKIEKEGKQMEKTLREAMNTEEAHRIKVQTAELLEQLSESRSSVNLDSYIRYFYQNPVSFLDFFDRENTLFVMDEPARLKEHADAVALEFRESMSQRLQKGYALPGQAKLLSTPQETAARLAGRHVLLLSAISQKDVLLDTKEQFFVTAGSTAPYNNSFEALVKDLKRYKKNGYRVLLLSASRTRARRLAKDLAEQELSAFYSEDPERAPEAGEVMTGCGYVRKGFEYPLLKYVILSESDIFGADKKKKKKRKKYEGQKIHDFTELHVGDYVVHESHGLGIYRGIEKVEVENVVKDYMKIEYRDGGNLYILATGFDVIQKYASADAKQPKLNKLGTQEWNRTRTKVKGAVDEVAKDLVELYALRMEKNGFPFDKDTVWQKEFEEMFPFEETEDQLAAIDATKADMESRRIMDRLICGDVGYGKTEIAIRAAFKAVQSGKQVVFLVPTTILAQQHYNTFVQRMKDFPVRVELLSRFRSAAEQKKTIADLKKGLVDIVIGTHRVLSSDVGYKDLGLLIVDEEQRFGVTHKEKLKKLKENVDVLTLTATPIPRTLHMSLSGIRDMSVLEEAPGERVPIQTYVMEYNDEMVREAIVRELARGGQVYYVYNRVGNIADIAASIAGLVPEANVAFAHGQMKEHELERIMYDFIDGEIDVLVSTTIIETGLDISNVNTIIIHDSDNMGLSQLYQLRGRVGRSNRTAYAFLMYKRNKMLKETAEKRLQAIREFTELGSGFKIAMRDLEIRGAGNLLGRRQHGHIEAVGYDLYCKMLNEAVKRLKGAEEEIEFPTNVDLDVDAYIPPSYIMNEAQKLDIYKRIAGIENENERTEMKDELLDRFGEIPQSVENLLRIALIRQQAHKLYLSEVQGKNEALTLTFTEKAPILVERIPELLKSFDGRMKFFPKGGYLRCRYKKCGMVEKDAEALLVLTEEVIRKTAEILLKKTENKVETKV